MPPTPPVQENASRNLRARVREQLRNEILAAARTHLSTDGPAGLSLRAVARDLGLVPSALYRYFASRDALLTALIVEAYRGLGAAATAADRAQPAADFAARWTATTGAFRTWALARPQEWALIYGSPVPGYRAPADTVAAALVVTNSVGQILGDAWRARVLHPPGVAIPEALRGDLERVRVLVGRAPDEVVPDEVVAAAVFVLGHLIGAVSIELFGQYDNAIDARDEMWAVSMALLARTVGLDLGAGPVEVRR